MDDLEQPLPEPSPELPVVDEAAEAEAARQAVAEREARRLTRQRPRAAGDIAPVRPAPVGATQLAPVKIETDEQYQALPPGAFFTGPDNVKRRKPWYVTDDASFDKVPEGEEFVDPEGQKRVKPKYEELPFTVQTLYNMAVNDKERLRVLEKAYPGKVKTTARGELYVDDDGVRRRGKGFSEKPGAFLAAEAAPAIGGLLGEFSGAFGGHRIVPYVGAMVGGVMGGGAGAAGGQYFNDIVMRIAGTYDRTSEEAVGKIVGTGAMGAAGSAVGRILLPMAPGLKSYIQNAAPGALAKFLGADKQALETALGLRAKDVLVPPSTWAKEAPHVQNLSEVLDPAFRTQRPLEQSATAHMERQGAQILEGLGVQDAGPLVKPTAAVPTEEAGRALQARAGADAMEALARSDAELADRIAQTRATAMAEDVLGGHAERRAAAAALASNQRAAQAAIDDGFREIAQSANSAMQVAGADANSGVLWQQVADRLRALRQAVVERHRKWYQDADAVAGNELPNIEGLPELATQFLAQLPEGFAARYPSIVKKIEGLAGKRDPKTGEWLVEPTQPTFGQLHQLRTELRSDVNWYQLNSSIDEGVAKFFQGRVDDILHDPNASPNLRIAGMMLSETDKSYAANMAAFNDARLNAVMKGIESGLPADPKVLFDTIVREGRSDLTAWVRDKVGIHLWAGVRAADVREMLQASLNLDGTIDGARFVAEVLKRHRNDMLETVHGPRSAPLIRQAQAIQALDGKIDIPVRPGDTLSEIIDRVREGARAQQTAAAASPLDTIEKEVRRLTLEHRRATAQGRRDDPLGFLSNPSVGATEAVQRVLASEDTILAAAARFGENSAEFQLLRQVYAQQILRATMDPSRKLAGISENVQRLMFPGATLDDMKLLASEMAFLAGSKAARGGAGRSIMATERVEHPLSGFLGSIGKHLPKIPPVEAGARATLSWYYKTITELMNSPALMRFVLKGLEGSEAEKFTARNMLRAMAYGPGANRGGAIGAGTGGAVAATPLSNEVEDVNLDALRAAQ